MTKLLSAGFSRLFKYKLFWALNVVFAVGGVVFRLYTYLAYKAQGSELVFDPGFFIYAIGLAIVLSAFCSLFVGKEYSDGTIRNKLIVGHTRITVYLSELIVCFCAGVMMIASYMIASFAVGFPLLGFFTDTPKNVALTIALSILLTLCYTALFVMIALVCSNKAANAVTAIFLTFAMLFSASIISSALREPEYYEAYSYELNGVVFSEEKTLNTNYLSGTKREVAEKLFEIIPGCQAMRISGIYSDFGVTNDFALYSAGLTVLFSAAGIIIFKKKNIK